MSVHQEVDKLTNEAADKKEKISEGPATQRALSWTAEQGRTQSSSGDYRSELNVV
jgi:hypothetical protein